MKACNLNSLYSLGMLIPGKAAEEIHLSGGFIYAGHTSHADSCLVLMLGFWRCSSASAWCHQMFEKAEWCFFLLSPQEDILLTFFSFQLWDTDASSGELCPFCSDVSKGNNHPVTSGFPVLPSGSFWNYCNGRLVLVPWPKLAWVTLRLYWDQNWSRREQRLNAIYHNPFPRLPEPLLISPMPQITDPILLMALLSKKTQSGPRKFPCCVTLDASARSWT